MSKELVISATSHERRVAILEEGQLVEIYIEREKEFALVGSIYKGKVTRVLPGMQSAFVDIGLDGDAFLYVSDVFENLEDYDHGHDHGHAPGDAPLPAIAGGHAPSTIELLPGESLATSGVHDEAHPEEAHADHAPSDEQPHGDYHAAEYREREEARGCSLAWNSLTRRKLPSPMSANPNQTLQRHRILLPATTPRAAIRRVAAVTAAQTGAVTVVTEVGTVAAIVAAEDVADVGAAVGPEAAVVVAITTARADVILPPSKYAAPHGDRDSRSYDNRRPKRSRPQRAYRQGRGRHRSARRIPCKISWPPGAHSSC